MDGSEARPGGGALTGGNGPKFPCGGDDDPASPRNTLISGSGPFEILRGGGATGGRRAAEP